MTREAFTTALQPERAPAWLRPLLRATGQIRADDLLYHRTPPPPTGNREAAVLVLFGDDPQHGPDVLLLERASTLRSHPGQVSFPGGAADPGDAGPVQTALREAEEETGLAPSGVVPLAVLPRLYLPPSGYVVDPVLAFWERPVAVSATDPAETATVVRVPVSALTDPANRVLVHHLSGYVGPAFLVAGLLVWGFTGGILSALLELGGLARPWDTGRMLELEEAWSVARETPAAGTPEAGAGGTG